MRILKTLVGILAIVTISVAFAGCKDQSESEFGSFESLAETAVYDITIHEVAEVYNDGTDILFGLANIKYKKAWFEYNANIKLGFDANKLEIKRKPFSNEVTITVPEIQVLDYDILEESMSDIIDDTGLFTPITTVDQAEALKKAKENGIKGVQNDPELLKMADNRIRLILEKYVENVGEATGKNYEVKFKDAE